jgi:hypothetical protein
VSGIDFLLAGTVDPETLHAAMAEAGNAEVEVVRSIQHAAGNAPILAEVLDTRGEYRTHVAVYGDFGVDQVRAITRALGMPALVADDSSNPYTMIRLDPDGRQEPVDLDAEALDEREEYRLLARP